MRLPLEIMLNYIGAWLIVSEIKSARGILFSENKLRVEK